MKNRVAPIEITMPTPPGDIVVIVSAKGQSKTVGQTATGAEVVP